MIKALVVTVIGAVLIAIIMASPALIILFGVVFGVLKNL